MKLLGELPSGRALTRAITRMHELGYVEIGAFAPQEVSGLEEAMRAPRSHVPRWALLGGVFGLLSGYGCQWSVSQVAWPLDVGGRPLHSAPAFIPITFEMTILFAAFFTLFGLFWRGGLGDLYSPLDRLGELRSASAEGFWITLDDSDARFERERAERDLLQVGAVRVVTLGDG